MDTRYVQNIFFNKVIDTSFLFFNYTNFSKLWSILTVGKIILRPYFTFSSQILFKKCSRVYLWARETNHNLFFTLIFTAILSKFSIFLLRNVRNNFLIRFLLKISHNNAFYLAKRRYNGSLNSLNFIVCKFTMFFHIRLPKYKHL